MPRISRIPTGWYNPVILRRQIVYLSLHVSSADGWLTVSFLQSATCMLALWRSSSLRTISLAPTDWCKISRWNLHPITGRGLRTHDILPTFRVTQRPVRQRLIKRVCQCEHSYFRSIATLGNKFKLHLIRVTVTQIPQTAIIAHYSPFFTYILFWDIPRLRITSLHFYNGLRIDLDWNRFQRMFSTKVCPRIILVSGMLVLICC